MTVIEPPRRPTNDDELGFTRRDAVRWFSPSTLARAATKVVLSAAFGDYLDKREMQTTLAADPLTTGAGGEDVWIDFIADTADGFDQTYTVAWCASQPQIAPIGVQGTLPRAQLVVFGGDEVYPYATPKEYEDRFSGPYLAALPWTQPDPSRLNEGHPSMLAIPGNHDWYDGLTGFMRLFAQGDWIGGRKLDQRRSYFAVDLPGPFWLWGIDIQSDNYVDAAQIGYFKAAAKKMVENKDDALILCTAKPSWTEVGDAKDAYRNLAFVERTLVPESARTILMLSGDKHHYARYVAADDPPSQGARMRITAGGGGAFLSTTEKLDDELHVPKRRADNAPKTEEKETFDLECCYPDHEQSRRLNGRIFLLGLRNPSFTLIPGILYILLFFASVSRLASQNSNVDLGGRPKPRGFGDILASQVGTAPLALILAVAALLSAFCIVPKRVPKWLSRPLRGVAGFIQTGCHVAAQAAVTMVLVHYFPTMSIWQLLLCVVPVGVVGAVAGTLIFSAFLFLWFTLFGWNSTEAFSSFRYTGYKNFLRIHVTTEAVTVYPIGIDKICTQWDYDPKPKSPEASWLKPRGGTIETRLIETEFTIPAPLPQSKENAGPATSGSQGERSDYAPRG